jgi:hypothetical protein
MIRFVTFAALAAFAATPVSATEIRVSLVGKSAAQLDAEVAGAARKVCMRQTAGETLLVNAYSRCVRATLKVAQANLAAAQSAD